MRQMRQAQGFTLLELSIVVAIVGILLSMLTSSLTVNKIQREQDTLSAQMDQIEAALMAFRVKNNRLPCPMVGTLADSNASFGAEAAAQDDIFNTCVGTTKLRLNGAPRFMFGVIPVRALGLPDSIAKDPWGRRISYAVDMFMTQANAFSIYSVINPVLGGMEVRDASDTARTTRAIAVVLSHGPNGHGAYVADGSRLNAGITNTQELENCNCTSSAAAGTLNEVFYQRRMTTISGSSTDQFDDTLRFYLRSSLATDTELQ